MVQIDDTSWFVAQLRPQGLARAQAHLGNQGFKCFAPGLPSTTIRAGVQKKIPHTSFSWLSFCKL